jgi:hypothetical protein
MADKFDELAERLLPCAFHCAYDWKDGSLSDGEHHKNCSAYKRPAVAAALREAGKREADLLERYALLGQRFAFIERVYDERKQAIVRDALRDMTAEVLRLRFEAEHQLDYRTGQGWCKVCHLNVPFGVPRATVPIHPSHNYHWPDWQRAAHELLGGKSDG